MTYFIWLCDNCSLLFTHPLPHDDLVEAQYDVEENQEHARQGSLLGRRLRYGWRALKLRTIGMQGSLLEIGCGQGDFLKAARTIGFDPVVGVEPEKSVARYAQGLGFDVRDTLFDPIDFGDQRFDNVVSIQVIEHIPDPVQFVKNAAKVLADEGRMLLETPCTSHPRARKAAKDWRYICPPWHLNLFNEKSLGSLFERAGLQLEQTWQHTHKAYISGVARKAT